VPRRSAPARRADVLDCAMPSFLYRYPRTGRSVNALCRRMHFVNPATGKVLGEDDDDEE